MKKASITPVDLGRGGTDTATPGGPDGAGTTPHTPGRTETETGTGTETDRDTDTTGSSR